VSAVVELCDRVLWLENGKIQMEGKAELVMREYVKCIQQSQGR
jgi:ABC-type polysaccharide/polyol phosphate transport system ATPase subunit